MIRKIIHMPAECSPNVRRALWRINNLGAAPSVEVKCYEDWQAALARGEQLGDPGDEVILPGVLTWNKYVEHERTWDVDKKEIGLRARFPTGAGVRLFPQDWLDFCGQKAFDLMEQHRSRRRQGEALGIDTAEGGNNTAFCVGDKLGVLELIGIKTADTNSVRDFTRDLQRQFNVPHEKIVFDIGGGGRVHCQTLRRDLGWKCQAVTFSGKTPIDLKRGMTRIEDRQANREVKSVFKSRRVEMYSTASDMMNPATGGYGVPSERNGGAWTKLAGYLKPLLRQYDEDGVMYLPPKEDLIKDFYSGESPDEADAFVLMIRGLTHKGLRSRAGAA